MVDELKTPNVQNAVIAWKPLGAITNFEAYNAFVLKLIALAGNNDFSLISLRGCGMVTTMNTNLKDMVFKPTGDDLCGAIAFGSESKGFMRKGNIAYVPVGRRELDRRAEEHLSLYGFPNISLVLRMPNQLGLEAGTVSYNTKGVQVINVGLGTEVQVTCSAEAINLVLEAEREFFGKKY